ncbi:FUSC family protein [Caballeronia sp. LZ043]|uniref:FUSC family protein n=1 Tax=Caballeronia sp. LZ043 TaxID=3038569 RepID=UPI0028561BDD|nr:FUSC family protein [Caballeronia sp. LZ043]MDR5821491.1 FUSC family protein [Caballeronia sp. LZ043]
MIAMLFTRAADRLLVADPGLARFVTALRATLATFLTAAICLPLAARLDAPPTVAGPGILFVMVAPLFLRDGTLRGWLASLLSLYVVALVSFALASALAPWPALADATFVALLCGGMLIQACGPRALGGALLALVAFYLGLYLHPTMPMTQLAMAMSLIAPCVTVCIARWIIPPRHDAALGLAVRTVTARARRLPATAPRAASLHTALTALNEAAISLEDRLALLEPGDTDEVRDALIALEVAANQYVFDASARADREARLRSAIAALERMVESRQWETKRVDAARASGQSALASLSWWPAARMAAAASMALLAGHWLSSERWFWAVITTFVVLLGTRSRGDAVHRAMQRIAGTLAGALVGALLVTSLHSEPVAIACAMLLCVFGWAYFILSAYGPGVFCITVLVSLVYGMLGHAVQPLVELRIGEVAIGCLASLVAAFTIKPLETSRHIEARFVEVIDAMIAGVRSADSVQAGAAVRSLDSHWQAFRLALRPRRVFVWATHDDLVAGALSCCVHNVRTLLRQPHAMQDQGGIEGILERLEAIRAGCTRASMKGTKRMKGMPAATGMAASLDGAVALLAQRIGGFSDAAPSLRERAA